MSKKYAHLGVAMTSYGWGVKVSAWIPSVDRSSVRLTFVNLNCCSRFVKMRKSSILARGSPIHCRGPENRGYFMSDHVLLQGTKFHSSARNYEWNLERTCNSSQSTHPVGRVFWEELLGRHITYYSLMFFIAYTFKEQVHVFAGHVKIVSHSSCRTSAILKYFCPLYWIYYLFACWVIFHFFFFVVCWHFSKLTFQKNLSGKLSLDLNCLQRLSADDRSCP